MPQQRRPVSKIADDKKNIVPEMETPAEAPARGLPVIESKTPTPDKEAKQTTTPGKADPLLSPLARWWTLPPSVKVRQKIRSPTNREHHPVLTVI